jgi:RimJ/RimL family protein N-acetyltransferase
LAGCARTDRHRRHAFDRDAPFGTRNAAAKLDARAVRFEGAIVGNASLHTNPKIPRRAHTGSLGMAVPAAWQRKGVGSALLGAIVELADHWLGLARLELTVYVDNEAALALYRKFDFEIHRRHVIRKR